MRVPGYKYASHGRPALSWSTTKASGSNMLSSDVKYVQRMRCSCRRMAHMMENRDRMEAGTSQLPRTRTSRVPVGRFVKGRSFNRRHDFSIPSRASSKQCFGSQWLVNITTLWPRFWSPTAASMINLSAPPIPKSG